MKFFLLQYKNNQSGAAAVEFAMIAVLFFTLVVGLMEAGRVFWTQNALQYAVEQASRVALVNDDFTQQQVIDAAEASLQSMLIPTTGMTTDINYIILNDVEYIEITGGYSYNSMVGVLLPNSWSNFQLNAYTRRPMSWD